MGSIPVGTAKKVYTPFAVYIVATIYSENTNLIASRTFSTTLRGFIFPQKTLISMIETSVLIVCYLKGIA